MSDIKKMTDLILKIRDDRNWEQFHTGSNLAKSISIEAAEILELFQWDDNVNKTDLEDEISDVLAYLLLLADKYSIDVVDSFERKMKKNEKKYPL